ncbi:MAG: molecular chaperone TorD family protein [Archangiaceae bacterium]|nr:molecular chaperone TorD family protein [Archangiaceae bacterium]
MTVHEDAGALEHRAVEFALAARLAAYPHDAMVPELDRLSGQLDAAVPAAEAVRAELVSRGLDPLRSEYLALFGSHQARVSLHETEYGRMRGMAKGNDLADLCGFYRAFGLEVTGDSERRDLPDHLACQLEFYAVLLARAAHLGHEDDHEGLGIVLNARRKFLVAHLGRLALTVGTLERVRTHPVYGPVMQWAAELVGVQCRTLAADPPPLDFFDPSAEPDEVCCAVSSPPTQGAPK